MQHSLEGRTILVRVHAVNTTTREVQCVDKHGGKIVAAYRQTPVIQQIPMTGEVWTVQMRDWHWLMDSRVEEEAESGRTAGLTEGDLHLKVKTKLFLNDGNLGYITWEQFPMNGTTTTTATLATAPVNDKSIRAYNATGLLIDPSTFTLVNATITFGTAPPATKVTIYYARV